MPLSQASTRVGYNRILGVHIFLVIYTKTNFQVCEHVLFYSGSVVTHRHIVSIFIESNAQNIVSHLIPSIELRVRFATFWTIRIALSDKMNHLSSQRKRKQK